jgi:hypothetical protein
MQIQEIKPQILKEHNIKLRAKQGSSPRIKIEILDDSIPYNGIDYSCQCTSVDITPTHYIVQVKQLHDVRHMVEDETQKEYLKIVTFDIIHLDNSLETVTLNITVYDPN